MRTVQPCDSFEDLDNDYTHDPMILGAMYNSGTKPGEDRGTKAEKKAYAEYYAKRQIGGLAWHKEMLYKYDGG